MWKDNAQSITVVLFFSLSSYAGKAPHVKVHGDANFCCICFCDLLVFFLIFVILLVVKDGCLREKVEGKTNPRMARVCLTYGYTFYFALLRI